MEKSCGKVENFKGIWRCTSNRGKIVITILFFIPIIGLFISSAFNNSNKNKSSSKSSKAENKVSNESENEMLPKSLRWKN